jgi:AbrB family looped-hinge helix DNA binding protein
MMIEKAFGLTFIIDRDIVKHISHRLSKPLETVKLSPKFQVVIPKNIRRAMNLKPGQKIQVLAMGDRIELVPERKLSDLRGFLRGIDTGFEREDDRT